MRDCLASIEQLRSAVHELLHNQVALSCWQGTALRAESLTTHSEPRVVQPERNFVLILNDNEHQIQFGEAFDTLEAAQDAGNEAIWGGRAVDCQTGRI